ncbi:hypothetical protein OG555_06210 [Kribbella sp. NBC_01484]|uniref:hypothetical protein n=1 Tax=Kribbella sp. NBC_01484 TaxID=2903579 RepID=UPI002E30AAC1|nr:hypothetical protein [Kribbella sp. NBC_01484]
MNRDHSFLDSISGTVGALLVGLGLIGGAAALVVAETPNGARDVRAYEAAPRCLAAPSTRAECRWTGEFTVSDIYLNHYMRDKNSSAVLISAHGARWNTFYGNTGPVLDHLDEGDRVTGTIWRGRLTEITAKGAVQETTRAPADMRARSFEAALFLVPSGLLITVACVWRLLRRRGDPTRGMEATVFAGIALPFLGLFCAALVGALLELLSLSMDEIVWPFAAVLLPAAILAVSIRRDSKEPAYHRVDLTHVRGTSTPRRSATRGGRGFFRRRGRR